MERIKVLWHKAWTLLTSRVINLFASQTNFDVKNTVLIIGSTRSGTTFLMESLNAKNEYRIIFEPFNPTYTKEWNLFSARHYIDPNDVSLEEQLAIDKILTGRLNNAWTDQYNQKLKSEKRIVKAVRANLLLDYLSRTYPNMSIVYIHRNPYDMVASRIGLIFDPNDIHLILKHHKFINRYYSDVDLTLLKKYLDIPECCHTAVWCFENRYLLRGNWPEHIKSIRFEYIRDKTVTLVNNILRISQDKRPPSVTTSLHKSHSLSSSEKENITTVLNIFGMKDYIKTFDE